MLGLLLARYFSLQINQYEVYRTESDRNRVQLQRHVATPYKNHERYYVYGAWWKSPVLFHTIRFLQFLKAY